MNDRYLSQLKEMLHRDGLPAEQSATFIMLLLAFLKERGNELPRDVNASLEQFSNDLPRDDLSVSEICSAALKALREEQIPVAVVLAQSVGFAAGGTHGRDLVALPSVLEISTALDPNLCLLIRWLTQASSEESAYTPWDDCGQTSAALAMSFAEVTSQSKFVTPSARLMSRLSNRPWKVLGGDPVSLGGTRGLPIELKFDIVAAVIPMGVKVDRDWMIDPRNEHLFPEKTNALTVLGLRACMARATRRVVVGVPNTLLFSPGAERSLRDDLISRGQLRVVISLPAGLLQSASSVHLSLLVLDVEGGNEYVRFVDADTDRFRKPALRHRSRIDFHGYQEVHDLAIGAVAGPGCADVTIKELIANDSQLLVSRYVLPTDVRRALELVEQSSKVSLGTLVEFVRPAPTVLSDQVEDISPLQVAAQEVGVLDLPEYGYISKASRQIQVALKGRASADSFLQALDLVLVIKGNTGKIGLVSHLEESPNSDIERVQGDRRLVASQSAIVMRVRQGGPVDARTLFVLLRSPLGQTLLKSIVSGATAPQIQLAELKRLEVPVPSPAQAERAVTALDAEEQFNQRLKAIHAQQAALASSLWSLDRSLSDPSST